MLTVLKQAQKFINAYSAFLKRQGKLPIPGTLIVHFDKSYKKDRQLTDDNRMG